MSESVLQGYKETPIGVIPKEWETTIISDVANITTGNKDTQDRVNRGKYPFFVRSQTIERINSYSFDGEAVLTAGDGVGTGKVFHYLNGKFDFHQRVYKISNFKNNTNGKFLYEYFKWSFLLQVNKYSAKGSVDSVRMEMIAKMNIPLPPLPEQQKIASILTSADKVIEKTEAQINKLKDLKKSMMQELLTKGIGHTEFKDSPVGKIPVGWEVKTLEDISIAPICYGIVQIGSHYPSGISVLAIRDLNGDYSTNINKVAPEIESKYSRSRIVPNDVLVSVKATIGRIGIVPSHFSGNISRDIARIRVDSNILPDFIKYFMESSLGQQILKRTSVGTTREELSIERLKKVQIPVAPKNESIKISRIICSVNRLIEKQSKKNIHTKSMKKALMQDLLTGKVRVKI